MDGDVHAGRVAAMLVRVAIDGEVLWRVQLVLGEEALTERRPAEIDQAVLESRASTRGLKSPGLFCLTQRPCCPR